MSPHDYPDEPDEFSRQEVKALKELAAASRVMKSITTTVAALIGIISAIIAAAHALSEMWRDAKP